MLLTFLLMSAAWTGYETAAEPQEEVHTFTEHDCGHDGMDLAQPDLSQNLTDGIHSFVYTEDQMEKQQG